MPKVLKISLNRFTFDYNTCTRKKLNDKVEFPFLLNFNDYMNGYEGIKNKVSEDSDSKHF